MTTEQSGGQDTTKVSALVPEGAPRGGASRWLGPHAAMLVIAVLAGVAAVYRDVLVAHLGGLAASTSTSRGLAAAVVALSLFALLSIAYRSFPAGAIAAADPLAAIERERRRLANMREVASYCWPAVLAVLMVAALHYQRVFEVIDRSAAAALPTATPEQIRRSARLIWASNAGLTAILTLLPFVTMAYGLVRKRWQWDWVDVDFAREQGLVNKLLVAAATAWGWLYVLSPHGQGMTVLKALARELVPDAKDAASSLPVFFDAVPESYVLRVAFLGWYIHLFGYFLARSNRGDAASGRVYGVMFRKFLITLAAAVVLSHGAPSREAGIAAFAIGFLPVSVGNLLTELGSKIGASYQDPTAQLHAVGMSRWEVYRLEEEGIESLADFVGRRPDHLRRAIPPLGTSLFHWHDVACLVAVLGLERYNDVKDICATAERFVRLMARSKDDPERVKLVAALGAIKVQNPEEIAEILRVRYAVTPRVEV